MFLILSLGCRLDKTLFDDDLLIVVERRIIEHDDATFAHQRANAAIAVKEGIGIEALGASPNQLPRRPIEVNQNERSLPGHYGVLSIEQENLFVRNHFDWN